MKKLILLLACALLPTSLVAAPINVSTIAVASGTVTVTTATSHGYAANEAVCLSAQAVCGAIATTPSGTTFTFAVPSNTTVVACASSCGTVTAAPQAIVLDVAEPDQTHISIHYVCWMVTTNPLPLSGATSAWKAVGGSVGASPAQNSAIAAGNIVEIGQTVQFPSTLSGAQLEAFVQNDCSGRQAAFVANIQPAAFYGFTFDPTTGSWVKQ